MIKILLVDDEYAQRIYLRKIIDWQSLGCTIVGESSNGVEALNGIHLYEPDVVFLDMDMPTMDGLTFLEHVHAQKHSIKTVIVSGHEKFEYACKAISYGVQFYLLKPIDKEELHSVLKEVITLIKDERSQELKLRELHEKLDETMPLLKDQLVRQMVKGNANELWDNMDEKSALLNVNIASTHLLTAVIEEDDDLNSITTSDHHILQDILEDACLNYLTNYTYDSFLDDLYHLTLTVDVSPEKRKLLLKDLSKLVAFIHLRTGRTITIGCSKLYPLRMISKAYQESYHILQAKTFLGANTVLDYNAYQPVNQPYTALSHRYKEQLCICIKCKDPEKLISIIQDIFNDYSMGQVTMADLRMISSELVTIGITHLASLGYATSHVFGKHYNPLHSLLDYNSLDGIRQHVISFYKAIYTFTKDIAPPKLNDVILKAQAFIRQHYDESELSLENIARNLYVHPVYLSSLFKKNLDMTISHYILDIRMKKAIELIKLEYNTSVAEIAALTGYANPYYFSKVFKKYYGASPTEIRRKA